MDVSVAALGELGGDPAKAASGGGPRPVFIGGCPRSGTTLLGAMLGVGPAQVTVPEAMFKWLLLSRVTLHDDGTVDLERSIAALESDWRFRLWGLRFSDRRPAEGRVTYSSLLQHLVQAYGERVSKPRADVWIDHTPGNIKYALILSRLFPDAKFVNLVRDGRAVTASVLPLDWGPNNVFEAGRWWATEIANGLAASAALGPERMRTVRYEDIVADGQETVRELCRFLDLAYDDAMVTTREYAVQAYSEKQHGLVARLPDPSRAEAWREVLRTRQVETFEHLTGELLGYLGYSPDYGPAASPPSRAEHVRDVAVAVLRRQLLDKARRQVRKYTGLHHVDGPRFGSGPMANLRPPGPPVASSGSMERSDPEGPRVSAT